MRLAVAVLEVVLLPSVAVVQYRFTLNLHGKTCSEMCASTSVPRRKVRAYMSINKCKGMAPREGWTPDCDTPHSSHKKEAESFCLCTSEEPNSVHCPTDPGWASLEGDSLCYHVHDNQTVVMKRTEADDQCRTKGMKLFSLYKTKYDLYAVLPQLRTQFGLTEPILTTARVYGNNNDYRPSLMANRMLLDLRSNLSVWNSGAYNNPTLKHRTSLKIHSDNTLSTQRSDVQPNGVVRENFRFVCQLQPSLYWTKNDPKASFRSAGTGALKTDPYFVIESLTTSTTSCSVRCQYHEYCIGLNYIDGECALLSTNSEIEAQWKAEGVEWETRGIHWVLVGNVDCVNCGRV